MTAQLIVIGYQVCAYCGGNGCARCHGTGEIEQRAMVEPDPTCTRCDHQQQEPLTYAGLCRDCDDADDQAYGFIPSHSGGVRGGPE